MTAISHKHALDEAEAVGVLSGRRADATNLTRLEDVKTSRTLWATYWTCSSVIAGYNGRETIRE
jgi:hypothetical protein